MGPAAVPVNSVAIPVRSSGPAAVVSAGRYGFFLFQGISAESNDLQKMIKKIIRYSR